MRRLNAGAARFAGTLSVNISAISIGNFGTGAGGKMNHDQAAAIGVDKLDIGGSGT